MPRTRGALVALLLVTACTSGGTDATPSATPSPSPTTADPYTALTPPRSPGIGDFDPALANRGYAAAQGLLAEALLERSTLLGSDAKQLATDLAGASEDVGVLRDLAAAPTANGLSYRPLLGKGVTVAESGFATVERSEWGGTPVQGGSGESALRITWSGAIRYRVTYQGVQHDVAYALRTGWIFSPDTRIPGGLELVTTLRGEVHVAPQLAACTAKGVLVPIGPAATETDFGDGPYPAPPLASPGPCPS